MTILTLNTLRAKGACATQLELFRVTFGESVDVTPELCLSVADKFDWDWAARKLLTAAVRADYKRAVAAAWADYERAAAAARADYKRAMAAARADYERAMAAVRANYARVTAAAFGVAFMQKPEPEHIHHWRRRGNLVMTCDDCGAEDFDR